MIHRIAHRILAIRNVRLCDNAKKVNEMVNVIHEPFL